MAIQALIILPLLFSFIVGIGGLLAARKHKAWLKTVDPDLMGADWIASAMKVTQASIMSFMFLLITAGLLAFSAVIRVLYG